MQKARGSLGPLLFLSHPIFLHHSTSSTSCKFLLKPKSQFNCKTIESIRIQDRNSLIVMFWTTYVLQETDFLESFLHTNILPKHNYVSISNNLIAKTYSFNHCMPKGLSTRKCHNWFPSKASSQQNANSLVFGTIVQLIRWSFQPPQQHHTNFFYQTLQNPYSALSASDIAPEKP